MGRGWVMGMWNDLGARMCEEEEERGLRSVVVVKV